jgi:hypothetical protein
VGAAVFTLPFLVIYLASAMTGRLNIARATVVVYILPITVGFEVGANMLGGFECSCRGARVLAAEDAQAPASESSYSEAGSVGRWVLRR